MNNKLKGYLFLIGSVVIYGLFGLFSRYTKLFPPFSQGYIRYFIVLFTLAIFFISKKVVWKRIEKKDIKWFLTWILPASFQPILTFVAFNHLPVGTTYFILYSAMIIGGIISGKIFFSEKFNIKKIFSFILILSGLFLIYRSDITLIKSVYALLAILSGLILGFWATLSKKVSSDYSEFQMMLLDSLSTFVVGLIGAVAVNEKVPPISDIASWLWIIVFAISGIIASFCLIRGFKYVEAQSGSLILPTELIFASVFGYFFLGEILKVTTYMGGFLIILAAIMPTLRSRTQHLK
ncbi:MAG: hypothetical protein A2Z96_03430 [Spirochaetes bacterium GWB1_48_6]|nr:MAG: hypothetical protein UX14_C0015G0002 [Parcubacteria group bacterium GW2011_GWF1_45_5]OHD12173.1 MAG: hypothetical protein A2Z96_03430 [Spirochaetes bacterium GWB1_48_6]